MRPSVGLVLLAIVALGGCAGPIPGTATDDAPTPSARPTDAAETQPPAAGAITSASTRTASPDGRVASILERGRAAVRILDANGTLLAVVNASVADDPGERYRGLSDATSLAAGRGMLFVFPGEAERTFVMRDMAFPLDMVFVDANGTITTIHHAPTEDDADLTRYRGTAKWVLEVPYGWMAARGVEVGDTVEIEYSRNATVDLRE